MRQLFTNLVKPTDAMAQAMEDLGISMTDAEGKTKSLDTLMGDLKTEFFWTFRGTESTIRCYTGGTGRNVRTACHCECV